MRGENNLARIRWPVLSVDSASSSFSFNIKFNHQVKSCRFAFISLAVGKSSVISVVKIHFMLSCWLYLSFLISQDQITHYLRLRGSGIREADRTRDFTMKQCRCQEWKSWERNLGGKGWLKIAWMIHQELLMDGQTIENGCKQLLYPEVDTREEIAAAMGVPAVRWWWSFLIMIFYN